MITSGHLQDKRRLYGGDSQKCPFCLLVHQHNTSRQLLCLKPPQSHKQLLPSSLSFGDAPELPQSCWRQVWDGVSAPMAQCPRSQCHCPEVWLLQVISPSPTAPSYPTAPPRMSPGWSEQGSLFHVVIIIPLIPPSKHQPEVPGHIKQSISNCHIRQ